jgi:hypothetical protein
MEELKSSFWHDWFETWVAYVLVGVSLIPFGLVYALLIIYRPSEWLADRRVALPLCLGPGLLCARAVLGRLRKHSSEGKTLPLAVNDATTRIAARQ